MSRFKSAKVSVSSTVITRMFCCRFFTHSSYGMLQAPLLGPLEPHPHWEGLTAAHFALKAAAQPMRSCPVDQRQDVKSSFRYFRVEI